MPHPVFEAKSECHFDFISDTKEFRAQMGMNTAESMPFTYANSWLGIGGLPSHCWRKVKGTHGGPGE